MPRITFACCLLSALPAFAADPPKLDRYGDPLPEGASARLGTLAFRAPRIGAVAFKPTGELVAMSHDMELYVWPKNGATKAKVTLISKFPGDLWTVASSLDGRFAVTTTKGRLGVWDISNGVPKEISSYSTDGYSRFCFSLDGMKLVVQIQKNRKQALVMCDLETKTWHDLPFDGEYADTLSFSGDGKSLVAISGVKLAVIDMESLAVRMQKIVKDNRLASAALSHDGSKVVTAASGSQHAPPPKLRVYSVVTGEEIAQFDAPSVSKEWVCYSPDGRTIFTGGQQDMCEWEPNQGKLLHKIDLPALRPVVFSPDGKQFAIFSGSAIVLFDRATCRPISRELIERGHVSRVDLVNLSRNGEIIATQSSDGEIRTWECSTGKSLSRMRTADRISRRVVFSNDSRGVFIVTDDLVTPVRCDATTGKELRRYNVPSDLQTLVCTRALKLSPDGEFLEARGSAIRSDLKSYDLRWNVRTGTIIDRKEFPAIRDFDHTEYTTRRSPNGNWSTVSGTLTHSKSGTLLTLLASTEFVLSSEGFSSDSRFITWTRSPKKDLQNDFKNTFGFIFEIATASKVLEFEIEQATPRTFSQDARLVAFSSLDHMWVHDFATNKTHRLPPTGEVARVGRVAFTPDSRKLISGHDDGTALVWDMPAFVRPERMNGDDLQSRWNDLAGADAAKALRASLDLAAWPNETLAFMRERLKPIGAANEAKVRELIADLGVAEFAKRDVAERELRALGDSTKMTLQALSKTELTAEAKKRVEQLLTELNSLVLQAGPRLQQARAVAVLERIGNDEARKILKSLASGLPEARQTREAAEALERLGLSR